MFLVSFEKLNHFLVKFIGGSSEVPFHWCSLFELLDTYGIVLPSNLEEDITLITVFTDKVKGTRKKDMIMNDFEPGTLPVDVRKVVKPTKQCSLGKLEATLEQLETFLMPIECHMDMLTFFKFFRSNLFRRCLDFQMTQAFSKASIEVLAKCLTSTQKHLQSVLSGTATYNEITAHCQINFEYINFDQEFAVLCCYFKENVTYKGIEFVRELFELLKFHDHIIIMKNVFEQYKLTSCSNDPQFKEVETLVCASTGKESLYDITAIEASTRMKTLRSILLADECGNVKYLELFKTVSNSTKFCDFIKYYHLHEKGGQATFDQKYSLITAQLMHEDYNETVLNQLPAAYKVMIPFMDTSQKFSELITKVSTLGEHFSQLETVCTNITLIRLWFSKAEVSILIVCMYDSGYLATVCSVGVFKLDIVKLQFSIIHACTLRATSSTVSPSIC